MKTCTKCNCSAIDADFFQDRQKKDGLSSSCKQCHAKYYKTDAVKQRQHRWRTSGAGKKWTTGYNLKRCFGLTSDDYARMLASQDGVCAICGGVNPNNALAVDHNHITGKIRGLLCITCNFRVGLIENEMLLAKTHQYLEEH